MAFTRQDSQIVWAQFNVCTWRRTICLIWAESSTRRLDGNESTSSTWAVTFWQKDWPWFSYSHLICMHTWCLAAWVSWTSGICCSETEQNYFWGRWQNFKRPLWKSGCVVWGNVIHRTTAGSTPCFRGPPVKEMCLLSAHNCSDAIKLTQCADSAQ